MRNDDIIRAWKSDDIRRSLTAGQRAILPEHPAGLVRLDQDTLTQAGVGTITITTTILPTLTPCTTGTITACTVSDYCRV